MLKESPNLEKDKKFNWLNLFIGDILRLLREKNKSLSIREIMDDTNVDKYESQRAVKTMEKQGLVRFENNNVSITEKGSRKAEGLYRAHKIIENFLGGGKHAHIIAHTLEHILSDEKVKDIKEILSRKKNAIKLDNVESGFKGIIIAVEEKDPKIIARLLGLGILPGNEFEIIKRRKDSTILFINGRMAVIGTNLCKKIFVIK